MMDDAIKTGDHVMARSSKVSTRYPKDLTTTAQGVLTEWRKDGFALKGLTPTEYSKRLVELQDLLSEVGRLEVQLAEARDKRDGVGNVLWDATRKVRHGAKAYFGDDSDEVRRYGLEPVRRGPRGKKAKES